MVMRSPEKHTPTAPAAYACAAAICLLIGIFPETFYQLLPYSVEYKAYSLSKVIFYLQLLLFSGLAFFILLPLMQRTLTISLDTDWFWRVLLNRVAAVVAKAIAAVTATLRKWYDKSLATLKSQAESCFSERLKSERAGVFARAWTIGTTALWIALLLTAYVLFYIV